MLLLGLLATKMCAVQLAKDAQAADEKKNFVHWATYGLIMAVPTFSREGGVDAMWDLFPGDHLEGGGG